MFAFVKIFPMVLMAVSVLSVDHQQAHHAASEAGLTPEEVGDLLAEYNKNKSVVTPLVAAGLVLDDGEGDLSQKLQKMGEKIRDPKMAELIKPLYNTLKPLMTDKGDPIVVYNNIKVILPGMVYVGAYLHAHSHTMVGGAVNAIVSKVFTPATAEMIQPLYKELEPLLRDGKDPVEGFEEIKDIIPGLIAMGAEFDKKGGDIHAKMQEAGASLSKVEPILPKVVTMMKTLHEENKHEDIHKLLEEVFQSLQKKA